MKKIIMEKIIMEIETKYDIGDIVIFEKDNMLVCGIIESYYVDFGAGRITWCNVRTSKNNVFTYSRGGDIAEWDIIGKIGEETDLFKNCKERILGVNNE